MFPFKENYNHIKLRFEQKISVIYIEYFDCKGLSKNKKVERLKQNIEKTGQEIGDMMLNLFEKIGD